MNPAGRFSDTNVGMWQLMAGTPAHWKRTWVSSVMPAADVVGPRTDPLSAITSNPEGAVDKKVDGGRFMIPKPGKY